MHISVLTGTQAGLAGASHDKKILKLICIHLVQSEMEFLAICLSKRVRYNGPRHGAHLAPPKMEQKREVRLQLLVSSQLWEACMPHLQVHEHRNANRIKKEAYERPCAGAMPIRVAVAIH